ncbi:hypothetical protein AYI69_g10260 [Smittium culicis]|uniref:Uncharacterized protein n=1 Tax=Smittium culicis TaxID=133412 RepID=A0A1R1X6Y5_9FUNG|nr:hypothetical protein AYI69_g10260 [Smittium culicis]
MLLNSRRMRDTEFPIYSSNRYSGLDKYNRYEYKPIVGIKSAGVNFGNDLLSFNAFNINGGDGFMERLQENSFGKYRHSVGNLDERKSGNSRLERGYYGSKLYDGNNSSKPEDIDTIDDILELIWPSESTKLTSPAIDEKFSPVMSSALDTSGLFERGYSSYRRINSGIKKSTSMNNLIAGKRGWSEYEGLKKAISSFEFGISPILEKKERLYQGGRVSESLNEFSRVHSFGNMVYGESKGGMYGMSAAGESNVVPGKNMLVNFIESNKLCNKRDNSLHKSNNGGSSSDSDSGSAVSHRNAAGEENVLNAYRGVGRATCNAGGIGEKYRNIGSFEGISSAKVRGIINGKNNSNSNGRCSQSHSYAVDRRERLKMVSGLAAHAIARKKMVSNAS